MGGSRLAELSGRGGNTSREFLCPRGRKCWNQGQSKVELQTPGAGGDPPGAGDAAHSEKML